MRNILVIFLLFLSAHARATITASPSQSTLCVGTNLTLTCSLGGGTWISGNSAVATVVSGSGGVHGVSAGTVNITYHVVGSGTPGTYEYVTLTVTEAPTSITGTASACPDFNTTLYNGGAGGTWSSSNTGIVTIDASTGVATAVSFGTATITYITAPVLAGCRRTTTFTSDSAAVLITPNPSNGVCSLCVGTPINLTSATSGGTWSSSNPSVATVSSSGVVNTISAAAYASGAPTYSVAIITYAITANCKSRRWIYSFPNPGPPDPVTGYSVCVGDSIRFTPYLNVYGNSSTAWSTSDSTILKLGIITEPESLRHVSGNFTGVSPGTATITFTAEPNRNGCTSTAVVTVFQGLPDIGGASSVCAGSTITLTNTTTGGTWKSSDTAVATISSGVVTGKAAGTTQITYKMPTSLCETYKTITVLDTPRTIGGTSIVCVGSSATFTDATSGGTWSSSNTAKLTIDAATGIATGVATGTATITYTTSGGCYKTKTITINSAVGVITGTASACAGNTSTLSDATGGGTWSSSNTSVATISSGGVVTAVSAGTSTITYSISTGCYSTVVFTVYAQPAGISGTASACEGATSTLSDATGGGTWSSSNTSVATVSSGGVVSAVVAGTAVISYTLPTGCYTTAVFTTYAQPGEIIGATTVCIGHTIPLTNAISGGTWSSSNTSVATIDASTGDVTGVAAGSATITYTLAGGCYATMVVGVHTVPNSGSISGAGTVCAGSTLNLTSSGVTGGTWSSSNTSVATVDASGVVTGVSSGSATITYTVTNDCGPNTATAAVAVEICCLTNSLPINTGYNPLTHSLVSGRPGEGGSAAVVDDPKWYVSAISADAIAAIGAETGFLAIPLGSYASVVDLIEPWAYSATSNWITALNAHGYHTSLPGDYSITLTRKFRMCGADDIKVDVDIADDNTITAADIDGTPIALVQTGFNNYGSFSHYAPSIPLGAGPHLLNITISNHDYGHTVYNLTGLNLSGVLRTNSTIEHLVREDNEACIEYTCAAGKHASSTTPGDLTQEELIKGFPNPSQGVFTLKGMVANTTTKEVSIYVTDILGNTLLTDVAATKDGAIDKKITLGKDVANGVYLVKVKSSDSTKVFRIVLER